MRVAALYDIHGNLPALEAVLAELERDPVDAVVVGGDVGAGPLLAETLARLRELGDRARFVLGNGDREVVDAFDRPGDTTHPPGASWCAAHLDAAGRDFIASFARATTLDVDGLGPTLFCHGSPRRDTDIITMLSDDARVAPMFAEADERTIVCGHTHSQFDRQIAGRRVINAGSVGIPYEGIAVAFWLLLGRDVRMMRAGYDVDRALAAMSATGYPDVVELLRESLLDPIAPLEAARFFEQQAAMI